MEKYKIVIINNNLENNLLDQIVDLHLKAFRFFFLTTLGRPFLRGFYKAIIHNSNGIGIGILEKEKLLAFAIGSSKKGGFYSDIFKNNFFYLGLCCLPSVIRKPQIIIRILKSLFAKDTSEAIILGSATLLSICVDPAKSKEGLGELTLKAFEKEVFLVANGLSLTTDSDNNDHVNRFYIKNNYKLVSDFTQGERKMNLYYKQNEK
jgi:hypothetical protein